MLCKLALNQTNQLTLELSHMKSLRGGQGSTLIWCYLFYNKEMSVMWTLGGDSNPPFFVFGQYFWPPIFLASWFLKLSISLYSQSFQHASLPFSCGFSAIFSLLASNHELAIILGAVFPLTVISECRKWHHRGKYLNIFLGGACPSTHGSRYATPETSPFFGLTQLCPSVFLLMRCDCLTHCS